MPGLGHGVRRSGVVHARQRSGRHRMANALVIPNVSDLPAAQQIATQCGEHQVVVFDPTLVDRVASAGLGRALYLPWDAAPTYHQMDLDAHRAARDIEAALAPLVRARWPGLSILGWQHLSLYYLAMSTRWYGEMLAAVVPRLREFKLHVPLYDRPQMLYFPSFVPALACLRAAQREGIAFQAYNDPGQDFGADLAPDLRGQFQGDGRQGNARQGDDREFLLTHLPTCLYDIAHINDELAAAGKAVVNVRARWFDQPVQAGHQVALAPLAELSTALQPDLRAQIAEVAEALRNALDGLLAPRLDAVAFRARQVEQLVTVYRAQLVTYHLMQQHFRQARPAKLLLSDHDTGLHGPLVAFAQAHHLPLLVLPHSKTSGHLDHSHRNTTALYHPLQGAPVRDADGRRLSQFALDLPTTMQYASRLRGAPRTIGLLLNSTSMNGVPGVEFGAFVDGIGAIARWCEARGLELVIRFKPGYSLITLLTERLGLDTALLVHNTQGTMADFTARCDLCLMYGAPTSGALELLGQSVPLLNPLCGPITQAQAATIAAEVVPRGDVPEMLRLADTLVDDALEFQQFRRRQFLAFAERFRDARLLRELL